MDFEFLGMDHKGRYYFKTATGETFRWRVDELSFSKLIILADINYWIEYFPSSRGRAARHGIDILAAKNWIVRMQEAAGKNTERWADR